MKTKIKRHSRAVISVILAISMLVSCMTVGLIATDAAKVTDAEALGASGNNGESLGASDDSEPVGSGLYLLWGTDNKPSTLKDIGATITQSGTTYTIVLPTGKTFESGRNYYFALSSETNRNGIFFSRDYYSGRSLSVSKDNSGKFSSAGEQTYNEADSDGTSKSYRMARVKFAQQVKTSDTGITITVDSIARSYLFETTGSVNYNVTVSSDANGSVTAGTTTVNAGGSATVSTNSTGISLTANPNSGYTFDKWTVTGGATVGNTTSRSTTLKATAAGTVTASFKASATTTKTIYYDNSTTKWTTPYAFAWTEGVANYLGEWPGSPMTLHKGKVWKIEVSTDAEQIIFSGKGSNQTKDLTIPTDGKDYYKNGEWITYSDSTSGNHYTATLGNTITGNKNLYSNINATFYDYYTDHEYNDKWYESIDAWEDGWVQNNGTKVGNRNPYTKLNTSLSEYAAKTDINVTYPMYFGSYYWGSEYHAPSYTRASWDDGGGWINDSNNLGGTNKALTGLSGKTITNGNINHYKQGVTDENGAPMVLFDEDWLTSRNKGTASASNTNYTNGDALATIINSNFPVRKTTTKNITFDVSDATWWNGDNARTWAHLWDDTDNYKDVYLGYGATSYTFSSAGYNHVLFVRVNNTNTSSLSWDEVWDRTVDLTISDDNNKFTLSYSDKDGTKSKGSWSSITAQTSDYYEFNSGNATDNIWFDNLTSGSPVMQYGAGTNYGQKSGYGAQYGFYPFDNYNDKKNGQDWSKEYAKDQGFGLKLEIDFTLGEGGKINGVDQEFNFSGDDDLWVFVDDQLILDLGGDHKKTNGSINFANKHVYVSPAAASIQSLKSATAATRNSTFTIDNNNTNKVHKMTIFYMERGMHESNLKFGFSFTPVGNEFLTEKQVSDRNVNTGFGTAVMNAAKDDSFTFTHSTSSSESGAYSPSAGKKYVLNDAATTTNTTASGTFDLKHGDTADFIDQFKKNTYFKIIETPASANKFSYTPNLLVTDMVTNQTISPNSNGSYKFITTKADPTELDATRIEAFFTNTIETQTLTVTKKLPTYYDPDTDFTVKVEVALDGTNYNTYALTYTKNGTAGELESNGTATLKRNESIVIEGIPKNAKVRVYEPAANMPNNYEFASYSVTKADNTTVTATKYENGCSFTLADNDTVTLNNSPYRYSITYKYESRLYGVQTYSVSGVFTAEEHTSTNVDTKVRLKKEFLKKYAPYEDNFMKTLTLNFDSPDSNSYSGGTYTAVLTFNLGVITKPHALIKMPYAHGNEASGYAATKDDSGKVAADTTTDEYVTADEYLGHFKVRGEYIEAPLEIYDGPTKKNFQYWTLNTLVSGRKGDFVTNNYSTKLNYTAYEDYYIEAVYSEADRPSISGQGTYTTITYLEDSRNQWNNGGGGSATNLPEGWLDHGDQIYVDFDLAFYNGDKLLQNPAESQGITTGLIIQKAGDLQADGDSYHYNDATYTSQINTLKGQENEEAVRNFITSNTQPTTGGKCVKLDIATKKLDNKNRIEYFYGLSNKSISTGTATNIKTYIYRAYSYINVGGSVTLSTPVYFNVYETATKSYKE